MKLIDKISNIYDKITQADLSWKNRPYDFYLLFGNEDESKSPWLKSNWNSDFKPYFGAIFNQAEANKEIGIRVDKFKIEKRIAQKDNKEFVYHSEIKLGRLKWDDKSHDKWTVENNEEYFQRFELWSPIWTICEKRQIPPEIFISISNERNFDDSHDVQFGSFLVIAIAKNLNMDARSILSELSKKVNAKATVVKTRRWGMPEKDQKWTFKNGIQDTFSTGIYEEDLHLVNFDALEFEPAWEVIYRQK